MKRIFFTIVLIFPLTLSAQLPPTSTNSGAPTSTTPKRDALPNVNIYFPEGELDIRVRKLIKNVLFEGQVNYQVFDGDISTFLRYKYYAQDFTWKIGLFDTIEFDSLETSSLDFDRVRGGLLLFEYPTDYNNRYLGLIQVDSLSYGDVTKADNNKTNTYAKLGYQFGSSFDERLNSIVGESRGRITPVLTEYREIGPQRLGWAVAVTQGLEGAGGDYGYTKFETEALKRFDFPFTTFLISRLHAGTMLQKEELVDRVDLPMDQQFSVPRYELFKLGGRAAMKGVDDNIRGTDEAHFVNELFFPIFRNRNYKTSIVRWNNLYGIGYGGIGTLGFDSSTFTDFDRYVLDAGAGFEVSFTARNYEIFLNAVYAQTLRAPDGMEGSEVRVSARTSR